MGKKPDYSLAWMDKDTGDKGNIGAAWQNDDGTISIKLNACVYLAQGSNIRITLFPANWQSGSGRKNSSARQRAFDDLPPDMAEGPPF